MNRMLLGYNPDFDAFEPAPPAGRGAGRASTRVFDEVETMSLAIDLLEVGSATALAPAMRRILRRAAESSRRRLDDAVASELSALLEDAARLALPHPATSRPRAHDISPARGRFFGLELEGLSPEDQEFETAKAFVRFAAQAARSAASVSGRLSPQRAAQLAVLQSARRLAPGWLRASRRPSSRSSATGPKGSHPGAMSASTCQGAHHA